MFSVNLNSLPSSEWLLADWPSFAASPRTSSRCCPERKSFPLHTLETSWGTSGWGSLTTFGWLRSPTSDRLLTTEQPRPLQTESQRTETDFFFKFYFNFAKCWLDTYTNDKTNYTHVRPTIRYTEFEGMTLFCDLKIYWMWRKECDAVSDVTEVWTHLSYCKLYVSVRRQVDLS